MQINSYIIDRKLQNSHHIKAWLALDRQNRICLARQIDILVNTCPGMDIAGAVELLAHLGIFLVINQIKDERKRK